MHIDSMDLAWIVVKDIKQAIQYYTETVGLKLMVYDEKFGWAELQGHNGGARIGIAEQNNENPIKAGQNACLTFTCENIEKAQAELLEKGAQCQGAIQEIPGHVKLLTVIDADGNHFQLVQMLN